MTGNSKNIWTRHVTAKCLQNIKNWMDRKWVVGNECWFCYFVLLLCTFRYFVLIVKYKYTADICILYNKKLKFNWIIKQYSTGCCIYCINNFLTGYCIIMWAVTFSSFIIKIFFILWTHGTCSITLVRKRKHL